MAKKRRPPVPAKFKGGDRVRVKRGIRDVDYPDMPLGGWAGTVTEVCGADTFTIRWSRETLDAIHPVFKKRCEIDGLDYEQYALTGDDLEPDPGGPLDIEHPTEITTKPLSTRDQDDRVRMVFGLTSNDPLPDVDDETLEAYHEYLSNNLVFPFRAEHGAEYGQHQCPFPLLVQCERIELPQMDSVVRRAEILDHFRLWIGRADAFHQPSPNRRRVAPLSQYDPRR